MSSRRVIILGSTGSIGTQTIDVVRHVNELARRGEVEHGLEVVGLAGRSNIDLLARQAAEFPAARVACTTGEACEVHGVPNAITGPDAAERLVREVECDIVVAAIVGCAGLPATLAAVELGRDVALANKETLVAAGALMVPAALRSDSRLLPVDSEHSAVWQCLEAGGGKGQRAKGPKGQKATESEGHIENGMATAESGRRGAPPLAWDDDVAKVILTASGGPFRTWTREQISEATPTQALKHPTWSMGSKVTIDSASLMNKALEIIEAHWLFGVPAERIEAVIHPQSIVHALVEFSDGGVIAHMAPADMRIPIQHALTWPTRLPGAGPRLDWRVAGRLDFEPPDLERFPALALAYRVIDPAARATTAGAVVNAANEEAVGAFLSGNIGFGRIAALAEMALAAVGTSAIHELSDVMDAQDEARAYVRRQINAG